MIDYQQIFHTGIRVEDLGRAMAEMGPALGVTWATVQHNPTQAVWTPEDGLRQVELSYVYSAEGPQHVELLQGAPGSVWHAGQQPGFHHVGLWVDDLAAETQRCLDAGWTVAAAAAAPEDGWGVFSYVVPPSGPIIELVWSAVRPRFDQWWAGGTLGNERKG